MNMAYLPRPEHFKTVSRLLPTADKARNTNGNISDGQWPSSVIKCTLNICYLISLSYASVADSNIVYGTMQQIMNMNDITICLELTNGSSHLWKYTACNTLTK